jgi:hypothetical protein
VFAFLLLKILLDHRENTFALRTFLCVVGFVAGMNLLNPDAFIAQKNLERYAATGKIDGYYMASLSADASAELVSALQIQDEKARSIIGRALYDRLPLQSEVQAWQSWNWSRAQEQERLSPLATELAAYKDYEWSPPEDQLEIFDQAI